MSDADLPTPAEIVAIHEEIEAMYDLKYTGSRVAAPRVNLEEIVRDAGRQDDVFTSAAILLRRLVTAHLFEDGNKRTAWTVTLIYLERKGETPPGGDETVERVLKRIRRFDVHEIATWLATGEIDRSRLSP